MPNTTARARNRARRRSRSGFSRNHNIVVHPNQTGCGPVVPTRAPLMTTCGQQAQSKTASARWMLRPKGSAGWPLDLQYGRADNALSAKPFLSLATEPLFHPLSSVMAQAAWRPWVSTYCIVTFSTLASTHAAIRSSSLREASSSGRAESSPATRQSAKSDL
jgi:hypothetical protein